MFLNFRLRKQTEFSLIFLIHTGRDHYIAVAD
jgi:predicted aspartyl protease